VLVAAAVLVVLIAIRAIVRGTDVRLALTAAAMAMGVMAGDVRPVVREILATLSNEKFVLPICTAMGFAWVLRHTECDRHLVAALTRPLHSVGLLLVPGVILIGFLVNMPVISQSATAVCIGAVVVPLMRLARFSAETIGATMLLGASIGGELLNPGAPELITVGTALHIPTTDVIPRLIPLLPIHLLVSLAIFWALTIRHERRLTPAQRAEVDAAAVASVAPESFRIHWLRAVVPIVPLVFLFVSSPPLSWVTIPQDVLVISKVEAGRIDPSYPPRLIGLAMLGGVVLATLANPRKTPGATKAFFDGAGYAFTNVISLIVTANCFGKAIEQIGLAREMESLILGFPGLMHPLSAVVPMGFAALSGSGMAATQSTYGFFVAPAAALSIDPVDMGAMISMTSAAGRTMSPFAAVTLMCAALTGANPFRLAGRVAVPLLASIAAMVAGRMLGLW